MNFDLLFFYSSFSNFSLSHFPHEANLLIVMNFPSYSYVSYFSLVETLSLPIDWTLRVEAVSQFIIINKYFSARAFSLWNLIQTELMKNLGPLYAARALKNPSEQLNILNCVLIFIFMTLMMYIHKSQYHKQFIQEIWLENLQKKWILFNSCNINRLFWISI